MSVKEQAFWGRYAEILGNTGITGHNAEWHMRRAQQFAYGLKGRKLNEIDSAYLDSYLDVIGRKPELEVWQLRQVIHALRILLVEMTRLDWPASYDWEGRLPACEDLASAHPTVAREVPPEKRPPQPHGHSVLEPETLAQVERIKEVVRVRGMSILTMATLRWWTGKGVRIAGYHCRHGWLRI